MISQMPSVVNMEMIFCLYGIFHSQLFVGVRFLKGQGMMGDRTAQILGTACENCDVGIFQAMPTTAVQPAQIRGDWLLLRRASYIAVYGSSTLYIAYII